MKIEADQRQKSLKRFSVSGVTSLRFDFAMAFALACEPTVRIMIQYEQLARRDRGDPARNDAGGAGGGEGAVARRQLRQVTQLKSAFGYVKP
jgi:hypothetical protein